MNELEKYLQEIQDVDRHPSEIAKILKELSDEEFAQAIKLVPNELIGDVTLALPDRYFDDVVESLSVDELSQAPLCNRS